MLRLEFYYLKKLILAPSLLHLSIQISATRIEEKSEYPQEAGEANSSAIIVEESSSSVVLQ